MEALVLLGLGLLVYFVPSLVANSRGAPNVGSIFVLNLLLGWTLIGWVVALAMAVADKKKEKETR